MAKTSQELKYCPSCKEAPILVDMPGLNFREWYIGCTNKACQVKPYTEVKFSKEEAIEAWEELETT